MSYVWAAVTFLNNVFTAISEIFAALAARRAASIEEKRQALEKALEDAKNAKTAEDAYNAQTGVVDSDTVP